MKHLFSLSILFLVGIALFVPIHNAHALNIWQGATCGLPGSPTIGSAGGPVGPVGPCSLCDGVIVMRNLITFGFELVFSISAGMIAWGAIKLMAAGGNEKSIGEAKSIMTSAIIGIAIAVAAWTIVNTVLSIFSTSGVAAPWTTITCQ